MSERMFRFAQIDRFLEHYRPLTPYGRERKLEGAVYSDRDTLRAEFDRVEYLIGLFSEKSEVKDRIEYHLSRIPLLSDRFIKGELRSELYNVKRFLHNYKAVRDRLDESAGSLFAFDFEPEELLERLGYEKEGHETFFINDDYSSDLTEIRIKIKSLNDDLSRLKESRILKIRDKYKLDFRFHDFLIVEESTVPERSERYLYIEPYDNNSVVVKPQLGSDYYRIHSSAKELLNREKELENDILHDLAAFVEERREELDRLMVSLADFDTALAKAALARKFNCIRPRIIDEGFIFVKELELIPLREKCRSEKIEYTALTARFDAAHIVINGSNMGGKTVVLKSLLFCQLLTQMGFFVPAAEVNTHLFRSINLIGDNITSGSDGLSSFGEEIMNLINSSREGKTLFIIDEFARTTNSSEAYALNSALLQDFSEEKSYFSFSSTHLENLPSLENLSFWMMKGLDYNKYGQYFHSDYNGDLADRTALINSFMDYGIEPRTSESRSRDALKIADILGLDARLIRYAEKYLEIQE